jgi:hypothetical protein
VCPCARSGWEAPPATGIGVCSSGALVATRRAVDRRDQARSTES